MRMPVTLERRRTKASTDVSRRRTALRRSAATASAWAGLRPGSPDGLPIIGRLPGYENVYVASGHFRNGVLLAPITGTLIAEMLTQGKTSLSLEPFSPARFS